MWNIEERTLPDSKHVISLDATTILKKINGLNISKSPGPDLVNGKIRKKLAEPIAPILSIIFKTSCEAGRVPSEWKEENISAIYKKGGKYDLVDYRCISITSIICKIITSLIKEILLAFLKNKSALTDRQFGFLLVRSTALQLLNTLDKWTETLHNGANVDAISCDYMKAFDTVPHQRLLRVLRFYI